MAVRQKEFTQHFPKPGMVEHDPMEIWATEYAMMTEAVTSLGLGGADIAAIGITNQRETTIVWDAETGKPVYNAIVWQDRRTSEYCDSLKAAGVTDMIRRKTGLIIDAYFSGTKIRWILENVPGARERAEQGKLRFGTVDSWLVWNLTGGHEHITDVSNASRTMLFNINTLEWDEELLDLLNIPASMMPQVKSSSEVYGETDLLGGNVPVAGIAGDQQAADAAAIYQRKLWAEQEKQSLEEMEAHGVEIIYPDKQPFMDAAAPMIERFKNDPVFHDLIDQIQNTHEKDN